MNDFHEDSNVLQNWRLDNLASGNGIPITPVGELILTYNTVVQATERIKIEKNAEILPTDPSPSPLLNGTPMNKKTNSAHWKQDETVPKRWKSCDKLGKKFRDPSGRYYPSRMDALRNMIKDKSVSKEDIEKMRRVLIVDGYAARKKVYRQDGC